MVRSFTILIFLFGSFSFNISVAQTWAWAAQIGDTTGHTAIYAMNRYSDTEFLFAGSFGSRNFRFADQTHNNQGQTDVFAALIGSDGKQLWATTFGGNTEDRATAIAADFNGNIYVAGIFNSISMKIGNTTLVNKGESDGFLVKITPQKEIEWAVAFGGPAIDELTGVATDSVGNVYVSGHAVDYQNSTYSVTIIKYDSSKNKLWERKATTPGWGTLSSSIVISNDNNVYLTGSFSEVLTFDANHKISSSTTGEAPFEYYETNAFIAKYDLSGNFLKAKAIEQFSKINAISTFQSELYLCGEKVNYGMGWGWPLMDSKIYTSKYNLDLEAVWVKQAGGENPLQSLDIANDISTDEYGNVYVTGYFFSEKITFGNYSLNNILNKDYYYQMAFVLKYSNNGDELWGKSIGGSHTDMGTNILATGNDRFLLTGNYESDNFKLGTHTMHNSGQLQETYVHLRPPRFSRPTYSFVAMHNEFGTGNNNIIASENIKFFPNPTSDVFTISFNNSQFTEREISVYSHIGKQIINIHVSPFENETSINLGQLNNGIYLIKVKTDDHVTIHKLVKK
jgi:hypothetical protein